MGYQRGSTFALETAFPCLERDSAFVDQQHPAELDFDANDGKRGDVLVRGLFQRGQDCIIDVRVTDLDAKSYRNQDPEKILLRQEQEKKRKHLEPCLQQRRSFVPFVVSTDGMMDPEAHQLLGRIAKKLAWKWQRPHSVVCSLVRTRVSIAIARATHLCLRGSRVPANQTSYKIRWDDGAGVGLFETDYQNSHTNTLTEHHKLHHTHTHTHTNDCPHTHQQTCLPAQPDSHLCLSTLTQPHAFLALLGFYTTCLLNHHREITFFSPGNCICLLLNHREITFFFHGVITLSDSEISG